MSNVRWQRLILRGFGCYRDEFAINLDKNSVLVLPNEAGKSTLVAGLAAIIFGLPATGDPAKFGQARYRNWYDPPEFSGELYFSVGSTSYHLKRNFATHQVSLRYYAQGQWVQMPQATGVDNPSATRPFRAYQETLQHLLGISSLDLFLATFCLTQPMPTPEGLDAAVQGLLAGAGGKATHVQQLLENELKQITRYYGEPLGRARGGNKDRQLEELRAEIAGLTSQMEAGEASSAELQMVQSRLATLSEERQAQQKQLATRSATFQAWSEWRTQAERYQHGLEQQQQVEQALYRARRMEEQAEALCSQLATYPLFTQGAVEWEQYLDQQLERERELARLQREQEGLKGELAQLAAYEEQTLADYKRREQELAAAVEQAQEGYDALATEEAAYSELEQDYQARFGDLGLAPAQLLAAIQQQVQGKAGSRRRQKPAAGRAGFIWASRLGGILLGAVSYWFWGRTAGPIGIVVSLACCLLGWLLPPLGSKDKDASSNSTGSVSLALKRCRDLQAMQVFLEKLLAAQATRPTAAAFTTAQAALTQAQTELASCQGMISAFANLETSGRSNIENRLAAQQAHMDELTAELAAAADHVAAQGAATPVDWTSLRRRYQAYCQLEKDLNEIRQTQAALWSAQQVDGLVALERRALDLQNNLAAIRLAWQTLVDNYPGLPGLDDPRRGEIKCIAPAIRYPNSCGSHIEDVAGAHLSRPGPSPAVNDICRGALHAPSQAPAINQQYEELKAEIATLQQELADLQHEEENLLRRRAQLEGQKPLNLALAYERLQELKRQEERLSLEVDALGLAYRELEAARIDYSASHRERLAAQVSSYFALITDQPERRVELDADFAVTLRGAAGQPIHPAQLSQGARDQLYLSLRLAIADLLAEDVRLPLIFDDPFVNCDSERLERIHAALSKIAQTRQIWLLTHNPQFADWGS